VDVPAASASAHHHHHKDHAASGPNASAEPALDTTPFPDEVPPQAATPTPAASNVKVHLSNVQATGVTAANVSAALPVGAFARCYHGAAGSHASLSVHLDLTRASTHARSAISDQSLADLGACVVEATKRVSVSGIPAGGASADVDVSFDAP
jgi:hypothetical protein